MSDTQTTAPAQTDAELNEQAAAQELYDSLKPAAEAQGRAYIVARMPPAQAALVQDQIDADFPPPPEPAQEPVT